MRRVIGCALPVVVLAWLVAMLLTPGSASAGIWSPWTQIDNNPPLHFDSGLNTVACPSTTLCVAANLNGGIFASDDPTGGYAAWKSQGGEGGQIALSCPAVTLCVGVTNYGDNGLVESSTDPDGGPSAWTTTKLSVTSDLEDISCPSTSLCVATDGAHGIATSTDPAQGGWTLTELQGVGDMRYISCPTVTLCVATEGDGNVVTSTDPTGGASAWTVTHVDSQGSFYAISCAGPSLCVAVDDDGDVVTSGDPTAGADAWTLTELTTPFSLYGVSCVEGLLNPLCVVTDGQHVITSTTPLAGAGAWTHTSVTGEATLAAISCASTALCAAVDEFGNVATATSPTGGTDAWTVSPVAGYTALTAIACPASTLCVATDIQGNLFTTGDPTTGDWSNGDVDGSLLLEGVSCASPSLCVSVDDDGNAVVSGEPGGGAGDWTTFPISTSGLLAVSCAQPSLCVAVGGSDASSSTTPLGGSDDWYQQTIASGQSLRAVSCPSPSLCVAVGDAGLIGAGYITTTTDPGTDPATWSGETTDSADLTGVSCASTSLCVAVDDNGNAYVSTEPTEGASAWTPIPINDGSLSAVSCPTVTLCVATGERTIIISNPAGPIQFADSGLATSNATAISCSSSSQCVAVDDDGDVAVAQIPPPPAPTSVPVVSGTAQQGKTLTETPGAWTGSPTTFTHQWEDCDSTGASCTPIAGTDGQTYVPSQADVGDTIRVLETAANDAGSATAVSAPTAVVLTAPPQSTSAPSISGDLVLGQVLTEGHGGWTGSPTGYSYQWQRCDASGQNCAAIAGATGQTYELTQADVGSTIRVQETATNAGGTSTAAPSAATAVIEAPVASQPPLSQSAPTVAGSPIAGHVLTATEGTWTGTPPLSYAYQWQTCNSACVDVAGAHGSTFVVASGDVGARLRVVVTATDPVGTASAPSAQTAVVTPAAPSTAAVRASLRSFTVVGGKAGRIGALLAHSGFAVRFGAPSAGVLTVRWSARSGRRTDVLATVRRVFARTGTATIRIVLTKLGKRLLRHAARMTIAIQAEFVPVGGGTTVRTAKVRLSR